MPKITDKLSCAQVLKIPSLLNHGYRGKIWTMAQIARRYNVSEQTIYYHIKRLRENGVKITTRKQGQVSVIYDE